MRREEPFLTDPKQIRAWLDTMDVKGWSISENGLVDIKGNVALGEKLGLLKRLPIRFGKVSGDFICNKNHLVSLEGLPTHVEGDVSCSCNQLVSLEGAPKEIGGSFSCYSNRLVSLVGAPEMVGIDFYCSYNLLVSLEGAPKELGGYFQCTDNLLVSLEGAPKVVGGDFYCAYNRLVSFNGAPNQVGGNFYCHHNQLVDFKGLEDVSIGKNLVAIDLDIAGLDNVFESLNGLPKDLYNKVVGLDMQIVLELARKRAANLLGAEAEELSSEVELG